MSKLQVDEIVNKEDTGSVALPRGAVVTGVATATTFDGNLSGNATSATTATEASEASAAKSGSALETSINSKTSPGKAIALSMVFG
jgi:hypothetical protein|tara:strand:- start:232 stop:489 length:258 start_codon:yes stop_codon:yes gene_type:complete